ncbi:hypothetical protein A8F95_17170 [Bacillus wudalianchiensis]|uniref:DUF2085 domain-containing protein n=2 Tax=Pseudobacillus wudalianchiensis TaxID=1743143 RepID=A0A1B9AAU9_9BACI|nr:hypothetical protein A8F95_17170 [Bacillus wudalianchiensis]
MKSFFIDLFTLQFMPCHRKPERSLVIKEKQFPVCFRCMFLLIGLLLSGPLSIYGLSWPLPQSFAVAILACLPLLADGFTQRWKIRVSNNILRSVTGLAAGIGLAQFAVVAANIGVALILS